MSRAYVIRVSEKLTKHVVVKDGIETCLEVLPILPSGRMAELLAAALEKRGFEHKDGEWVRVEDDGIVVKVDVGTGKVTVTLEGGGDVELEETVQARSAKEKDRDMEERLRENAQKSLEKRANRKTEEMREALTKKLEGRLADLRDELDDATNEATAAALKEKAASMGEIQSIEEDAETGGLTIRVKL